MPVVVLMPWGDRVVAERGEPLFDVIRRSERPLASSCDGDSICGWCRVVILEGAETLPAMEAPERALLARRGLEPGLRIACGLLVQGDLTVTTTYW